MERQAESPPASREAAIPSGEEDSDSDNMIPAGPGHKRRKPIKRSQGRHLHLRFDVWAELANAVDADARGYTESVVDKLVDREQSSRPLFMCAAWDKKPGCLHVYMDLEAAIYIGSPNRFAYLGLGHFDLCQKDYKGIRKAWLVKKIARSGWPNTMFPTAVATSLNPGGRARGRVSEPRPGVYRHYKGNLYRVDKVVRHSETEEELVVYQQLYGDYGWWARPAKMFLETVEIDGQPSSTKRFTLV